MGGVSVLDSDTVITSREAIILFKKFPNHFYASLHSDYNERTNFLVLYFYYIIALLPQYLNWVFQKLNIAFSMKLFRQNVKMLFFLFIILK